MNAYLYIFDLRIPSKSEYPLLDWELSKNRPYYKNSRYLIREVLEKHNIPLDSFNYQDGKPYLNHKMNISLSHCNHTFVIALMQTEKLGVDIQTYLAKNLKGFGHKYPHIPTNDLLVQWTLTEAYCKATQSSLFKALRSPINKIIKDKKLYSWHDQTLNISIVSTSPIDKVHIFKNPST